MNKYFLSKLSELQEVKVLEITPEALLRMVAAKREFVLILVTGETDKEMMSQSEKLFDRLCQLTVDSEIVEISHSMFPIEWERACASQELKRLRAKEKTVIFITNEVEGLLWLAEGKRAYLPFFEYYCKVGWLRVKPILD